MKHLRICINDFVLVLMCVCNSFTLCVALPKLILISMDGFGYNTLDTIPPKETENFQYMIRNGVKAKAVMNVFPTVTYPNHYTMITGLYPESHGIVHNRFYDSRWKEYFHYNSRRDNVDPFWYDVGAEPIYVTNKKAGGNCGSVLWPAGIGKVMGIGPDKSIPGEDSWSEIDDKVRVDTLIEWFSDEKEPINLGLLYFLEPDYIAHVTGAGSKNVTDYIKGHLNDILGYLFERLREVNLFDEMNVILTSDHGLVNQTREKAVVLSDHLNPEWYTTGTKDFQSGDGDAISLNIFPKEGKEEQILRVLRNISHLKVYTKGDPGLLKMHYSSSDRIAPIVITGASEGVLIYPNEALRDNYKTIGVHGYDPRLVPNMRPFFLAMGPAFKKGYVSEQFDLVDIYPLMCSILGLEPAPNNGSFDNVKGLLREKQRSASEETQTIVIPIFVVVVGLGTVLAAVYLGCTLYTCYASRHKISFNPDDSHKASDDTRL